MAITINCPCGKILAASDDDAGMPAKCPGCGRKHILPGGEAEPTEPTLDPKKLKAAEKWMRGQQSRLWQLALAVVVIAAVLIVASNYVRDRRAYRAEPITPTAGDDDGAPAPRSPAELGDEDWMTDFDAFSAEVRALARHEYELQGRFANQPLRWTVTFEALGLDGGMSFVEAGPLRKESPAINVWAILLPDEIRKAQELEPGQKITIRGSMGSINSARSAKFPMGVIQMGIKNCVIE